MKVVLDANILASAVLTPNGLSGLALNAWRSGAFELCSSTRLLDEASGAVSRPSLMSKYQLKPDEVSETFEVIRRAARLPTEPVEPINVVRDPKDNHVLECAIGCEADLIVTNDDDLLALKNYEGIGIASIRDFLRTLGLA